MPNQSQHEIKSLQGQWGFAIDPDDMGTKQQWFMRRLENTINLPGSLQQQGYGSEISVNTPWVSGLHDPLWYLREEYRQYAMPDNMKVPFLLQPKKHYLGAAWYQKDIIVPEEWQDKRIILTLERVNWQSTLWLNSNEIGSENSLSTPHQYDLGYVPPGKHTITLKVDNRLLFDMRPDGHSISDSVGSTWNGIIGDIQLEATSPVWIKSAKAFPNIEDNTVLIKGRVGNITAKPGSGKLVCGNKTINVNWDESGGQYELKVKLADNRQTWNEFNPKIQQLKLVLKADRVDDSYAISFGLRYLRIENKQFILNNKPIHFRGTHDAGAFPIMGYPAMDVDAWKHIFAICKEHGLNHVRYHSVCPPKAAFEVADELGMYLQVECATWTWLYPHSPTIKWLYEETEKIIAAYGNHPSFMLLSHGNEPSGQWPQVLPQWLNHFKKKDPRRLYCLQSGRQVNLRKEGDYYDYWNNTFPEQEYLVMARIGPHRLRGPGVWNGQDYSDIVDRLSVPVITHEVGQWCAFPDLDDAKVLTGHLQGKNFAIYSDLLHQNGLFEKADQMHTASGKLQALCYKEEIEANLRTPGIGGFQLLDLHDYPGQGISFIGVLNFLWQSKDYITPKAFRRFCNVTVPLARFSTHIYSKGETIEIPVDIYHYGEGPLENACLIWQVAINDKQIIAQGELPPITVPLGSGNPAGTIVLNTHYWPTPGQYRLEIKIKDTVYKNRWDFWVYPTVDSHVNANDIHITEDFDSATIGKLENGENVLFFAASRLSWDHPPFSFYPIFWNRLMNPNWNRSLGILCDPSHPALDLFPTHDHADMQWKDILNNHCRAVDLNAIHPKLEPIVLGIDDWNRCLKLGILFECRIGAGRLMVCAADLQTDLHIRPAAKQLLQSIVTYMKSPQFNPKVLLEPTHIINVLFPVNVMKQLGAKISANSENPLHPAANIIDGNPQSFWQSDNKNPKHGYPFNLSIEFINDAEMLGLIVMQTQNDFPRRGHVKDYQILISGDGNQWNIIAQGELRSSHKPQKIMFGAPKKTRYLRFNCINGFGDCEIASLAELAVIHKGMLPDSHDYLKLTAKGSATEDVDDPTA